MTAWSWSPETFNNSNDDDKKDVLIAIAGQDTRVLLYHTRLGLLDVPGLNPIKSTVSDMAFDRTRGTFLALLTDDKLLRVFAFDASQPSIVDKNGDVQIPDCVISWPLSSRGVSVSFHAFLSDHLLLAEESGAIRFLNLQTKEWIFSVHEPAIVHSPFGLRSADWNPTDPNVYVLLSRLQQ